MIVIDTVGYFGGSKGQIVSFHYKSSDGYRVLHENLHKWLETELALLASESYFLYPTPSSLDKEESINGYYTKKFPSHLPLT